SCGPSSLHAGNRGTQSCRRDDPGYSHPFPFSGQRSRRADCCSHHSVFFASIWLDLSKIPANLLSLGALDFGMVVDGAVVMVENIIRHLNRRQNHSLHGEHSGPATPKSVIQSIREAAHEVQRPVFYAIAIIITAYMPIFTLQRVEGRLFRPMALTVAFALLGALTYSIFIAPVLSAALFRKGIREWHNPVMTFLTDGYRRRLRWCLEHRGLTIGIG